MSKRKYEGNEFSDTKAARGSHKSKNELSLENNVLRDIVYKAIYVGDHATVARTVEALWTDSNEFKTSDIAAFTSTISSYIRRADYENTPAEGFASAWDAWVNTYVDMVLKLARSDEIKILRWVLFQLKDDEDWLCEFLRNVDDYFWTYDIIRVFIELDGPFCPGYLRKTVKALGDFGFKMTLEIFASVLEEEYDVNSFALCALLTDIENWHRYNGYEKEYIDIIKLRLSSRNGDTKLYTDLFDQLLPELTKNY